MTDIDVPVLIVGGGGAGLTASLLLSDLGIETLLINEREHTSRLPKAHVLQQRAMEVMRSAGVADDIYRLGTPPENMAATAWYAGLAGSHPSTGRRIAKLEAWGAGGQDPDWASASPCMQANFPQLRLEPLLKQHAERKAPGTIRFGHELVALEQREDGVTATVLDKASGEQYTVRAQYLLGADGGRSVGKMVGIDLPGPRDLLWTVTMHMTADLSQLLEDDEVLLRWYWPPSHPGAFIILAAMGPERWGRHSEEWVLHMSFPEVQPQFLDDDVYVGAVREILGLGDIDITVNRITRWTFNALVADRFKSGRVFVLGDAAHQHGPTGGLGLTTAVQDAHNLAWKLAAVLKGQAGEALLDTYEPERKPVAARNVQRSTENGMHHLDIAAAMGIHPGQSPDAAWASIERFWSGKPEDREYRDAVRREITKHSMEMNEHGVEFGYWYEEGALVPDGSLVPEVVDPVRVSPVTTRPGAHVPHAFLTAPDGERVPIIDLKGPGEFLLLAGEDGTDWVEAAAAVSERIGTPIRAVTIGHAAGEYFDERLAWLRRREVGETGAVLVRPDNVVAWRAMEAAADPAAELESALGQILAVEMAR